MNEMRYYIAHDKATGAILRTGSTTGAIASEAGVGEAAIECAEMVDDTLAYVVDGAIVARPTLDYDALPVGSRVTAHEVALHIDVRVTTEAETSLQDAIDVPGTWDVAIRPPFPYQSFRGQVDVA